MPEYETIGGGAPRCDSGWLALCIWWTRGLAITCFPLALIIIGGVEMSYDHKNDMVPIYLIVLGVTIYLMMIVLFCIWREVCGAVGKGFFGLLCCFFIAWLIAGNVWTFGAGNPIDHSFESWPGKATFAVDIVLGCLMVFACCYAGRESYCKSCW